jgi:hypothetical protein
MCDAQFLSARISACLHILMIKFSNDNEERNNVMKRLSRLDENVEHCNNVEKMRSDGGGYIMPSFNREVVS